MFPWTRRWAAGLLLLAFGILQAGCSGLAPKTVAAGEPAISTETRVPDLMLLPRDFQMSLSQMEQGLREYVNQGEGLVTDKLHTLYEHWALTPMPNTTLIQEADLDGDGSVETIIALNDTSSVAGSGSMFVIYQADGRYQIDRSSEVVFGAGLHTTADIDGDGRQEIIWSSSSPGANTVMSTVFVSRWRPGQVETLPGDINTTFATVTVEGSDLLVSGGRMGGWGAGVVQRTRTDRYRWKDGQMQVVDRWFESSSFSYHRLQDGILAETWGHDDQARQAYQEAMDPHRTVLEAEDTVPPEWEQRFANAVQAYARFRLGLLLIRSDQGTEAEQVLAAAQGPYASLPRTLLGTANLDTATAAASTWAVENPEFLEALNIPRGWVNPQWTPANLCGPLPIN